MREIWRYVSPPQIKIIKTDWISLSRKRIEAGSKFELN